MNDQPKDTETGTSGNADATVTAIDGTVVHTSTDREMVEKPPTERTMHEVEAPEDES